jgi:catechol 2,3-dioxygenase-like lactoylglutathione lyase family enzyme
VAHESAPAQWLLGGASRIVEVEGRGVHVATAGLEQREARQPAVILQSHADTTVGNVLSFARTGQDGPLPSFGPLDSLAFMLDHIDFDTANFEVSRDFYIACLAPLGIELVLEHTRHTGLAGAGFGRNRLAQFFIGEGKAVRGRLHFAFEAQSQEAVDSFYREALKAGAQSKGEPGIRTRYAANWYAAFVYDPDGHTVEAIYRIPTNS